MKHYLFAAVLLFNVAMLSCNNEKDKPVAGTEKNNDTPGTPPPHPPDPPNVQLNKIKVGDTMSLQLSFLRYDEGDYAHLIFLSPGGKKEWDFGHPDENKLNGIPIVQKDEKAAWGYRVNPVYLNKSFTLTLQYKNLDGMDLDGQPMKYKDWRIIRLKDN